MLIVSLLQVFGILQELGQICNHPHLYNDHVKELERNRNKRRPYSQDDSSSDVRLSAPLAFGSVM